MFTCSDKIRVQRLPISDYINFVPNTRFSLQLTATPPFDTTLSPAVFSVTMFFIHLRALRKLDVVTSGHSLGWRIFCDVNVKHAFAYGRRVVLWALTYVDLSFLLFSWRWFFFQPNLVLLRRRQPRVVSYHPCIWLAQLVRRGRPSVPLSCVDGVRLYAVCACESRVQVLMFGFCQSFIQHLIQRESALYREFLFYSFCISLMNLLAATLNRFE